MAQNNIELITTYSPKYWDIVYKQEAVTAILDANPKLINFTGAKTVKIGKWQNGGLQSYYRNNAGDGRVTPAGQESFAGAADFGYQKSSARLVWEEFTLACDRGAAFEIEYFDNEESGDELVGLGVTEISRTAIIPEVDAYCLSKLAGYCDTLANGGLGNKSTFNPYASGATPLKELNTAFLWFENHEVPEEDQVVFASPAFMNALRNTSEVTKFLGVNEYDGNKDIKFQITKYQGRDLITTSPNRLRTNINLVSSGYEGGYSWGTGSEEINFIACAKSAVMHVVKYQKVKIISGEVNLAARGFDGYTIFARIYHDVFVPDNKQYGLYLSVVGSGDAKPAPADIVLKQDSSHVVKKLDFYPADQIVSFGQVAATETPTEVPGTITALKVGDTLTSATTTKAVYVYAYAGTRLLAVKQAIPMVST